MPSPLCRHFMPQLYPSRFHLTPYLYPSKPPDFPSSVGHRSEEVAPCVTMVEFPSSHARSPMHVPLAHRAIQPACTPSLTCTSQDKKPMQYHSTIEAMVGSDYPVLSCLVDVHKSQKDGWRVLELRQIRWFLYVYAKWIHCAISWLSRRARSPTISPVFNAAAPDRNYDSR
ncbi:hypothetical protein EDB83DRAFT_1090229 [Lactarius deliciosus]|nr:hypothetical protein EDB83DRAFT_1090229 [Lactarius deliciosus]